jgi:glycosyltransferase involved in cell wall biosynthesis/uncharacterized membrane protein
MKFIIIPNMPVMSGRHYSLATELIRQGHTVHYVMWQLPFRVTLKQLLIHLGTSLIPRRYRHQQVTVHQVSRLPYFWPIINGWLFQHQLRSIFHKEKIDLIITESYTNETEVPADLPFVYDLADDYPAPADIYGSFFYKLAFKLLGVRRVMARQCRNARAVTAVSEILKKYAEQYNNNVISVPNGVESELIDRVLKKPLPKKVNPHSLIYVSGFGEWSRAIETLEVVVKLKQEFPKLELTLVGSGMMVPAMKEFIQKQNAGEYIRFYGRIDNREELYQLIRSHSIGLNISDKNKWRDAAHPMKVLEYSALGKKVVSTDLEEVKRLGFNNLYLFSSGNKGTDLTQALRTALTDKPSEKDLKEVQKIVCEKYNWELLSIPFTTHANTQLVYHVTPAYPPALGGLEEVVATVVEKQRVSGIDARVITSCPPKGHTVLPEDTKYVTRLPFFSVANTRIQPRLFFELMKIPRYAVVHLHVTSAYMPELVRLASWIKGYRYIVHLHLEMEPISSAGILLKIYKPYILRPVLLDAKYVIVFTQDQAEYIHRSYGVETKNIKVVPNGIDEQFYIDAKKKPGERPHILFVGRLHVQKNIPMLLHALEGVSDKFKTTIAGNGPLETELKALAERLKLKNISFIGRVTRDQMPELYNSSDIVVLTSDREGMPLTLLEATASGTPVIATDVSGNRDVIEHEKNGLLIEKRNPEALRAALLRLGTDQVLYKKLVMGAKKQAKKFSWDTILPIFASLYKKENHEDEPSNTLAKLVFAAMSFIVSALVLLNLPFGWLAALVFYLLVPGYLLLERVARINGRWEVLSYSLGLSLLIIMLSILAMNTVHYYGFPNPLTLPNIVLTLQGVTLILILFTRAGFPAIRQLIPRSFEEAVVIALSTILPFLAAGGAFRLNNGAGNEVTMFMFILTGILFVWLALRKNLERIYPYALIMMSMAILFSNSLRGWHLTGHDIHREFAVFAATFFNEFWRVRTPFGSPYNACLSITILPTVLAHIGSVSLEYVYKVLFQIIFSIGVVPVFLLARRLTTTPLALVVAFLFISFPNFVNDMPFLNRQEIAFIFFGLILLTNFSQIQRHQKMRMILVLIVGLVLSHYSSTYVAVGLFGLAWMAYKIFRPIHRNIVHAHMPLLDLRVILFAFALTFLWHSVITASTNGLEQTIKRTINDFQYRSSSSSSFARYSLVDQEITSIEQEFNIYTRDRNIKNAEYIDPPLLPVTETGRYLEQYLPAPLEEVMSSVHAMVARFYQVLVIIGLVIFFFVQWKRKQESHLYYWLLGGCSVAMLVFFTVLPSLAIDYSLTRLFHQTMIITGIPIMYTLWYVSKAFWRLRMLVMVLAVAALFLYNSGVIPQTTGATPPKMTLNNNGLYYYFFYQHTSDMKATDWLSRYKDPTINVHVDTTAIHPPRTYRVNSNILHSSRSDQPPPEFGYVFLYNVNVDRGIFRIFLNSDMVTYSYPTVVDDRNLIYNSGSNKIYDRNLRRFRSSD